MFYFQAKRKSPAKNFEIKSEKKKKNGNRASPPRRKKEKKKAQHQSLITDVKANPT